MMPLQRARGAEKSGKKQVVKWTAEVQSNGGFRSILQRGAYVSYPEI